MYDDMVSHSSLIGVRSVYWMKCLPTSHCSRGACSIPWWFPKVLCFEIFWIKLPLFHRILQHDIFYSIYSGKMQNFSTLVKLERPNYKHFLKEAGYFSSSEVASCQFRVGKLASCHEIYDNRKFKNQINVVQKYKYQISQYQSYYWLLRFWKL